MVIALPAGQIEQAIFEPGIQGRNSKSGQGVIFSRDSMIHMSGVSVNLSEGAYQGGVFQIREQASQRITCEIAQTASEEAHEFTSRG